MKPAHHAYVRILALRHGRQLQSRLPSREEIDTAENNAVQFPRAAAIASFIARTPAAGPSGCPHTAPITARKSAPASTSGAQFAAVIPPIATHGSSIRSDHQRSVSGSARVFVSLLPVGKNAPN